MRLEEAFSRILDVESQEIANNLSWQSMKMWPLVRQCLWVDLTQAKKKADNTQTLVKSMSYKKRIFDRLFAVFSALRNAPSSTGAETVAFISRPVYLQALPNGDLFDRIVDPLAFCLPSDILHSKYYVAKWPERPKLFYPAFLLRPSLRSHIEIPEGHRAALVQVACAAGIDPQQLLLSYAQSLRAFDRWYRAGQKFLAGRKQLKTMYVTGWYFPDMMGLIAAANDRGVRTVDVQHGKQGKFQAMYSGWCIPEEGYQMMPDVFWCWGKPSADHILAGSPNRKCHRPVIGGYTWLDYYRRHIASKLTRDSRSKKKHVLVTIQPPQADNFEPIPDFIINFLRTCPKGFKIVFRCHPNDRSGSEYCRSRLFEFPSDLYEIDTGSSNLYDQLMIATHHVTAYSSCCYEAKAFGVPTLLFGVDAHAIYRDEIESGLFSWTPGIAKDLAAWLEKKKTRSDERSNEYITSSLDYTTAMLERAESDDFEYHRSATVTTKSIRS